MSRPCKRLGDHLHAKKDWLKTQGSPKTVEDQERKILGHQMHINVNNITGLSSSIKQFLIHPPKTKEEKSTEASNGNQ